jgi:hypothetical protein
LAETVTPMLRTLCASTLIALVLCPFTAPFGAIDPAERHADAARHPRPLAPGRSALTGTTDPTAVAIVPQLRSPRTHTTRAVVLPSVRVASRAILHPAAGLPSARRAIETGRHSALPAVLRL